MSGAKSDTTSGNTRVIVGTATGYAAWAAEKGLFGSDAAWNATPERWGGWANAFVYTYGDELAAGTLAIMAISFDDGGDPVITTAPIVEGRTEFSPAVIGSPDLEDWNLPVYLDCDGDNWTLPPGESANFFRVRLEE